MEKGSAGRITGYLEKVKDPRIGNATRHKLIDIMIIAICGVICGADGWSEIEIPGKRKEKWLKTFLDMPHDVPSHNTFGRVFARIDPEEFRRQFME